MLVVGKGGATTTSYGGGSGMVAYKKNMEIIPETFSAISVNFTNDTLVWLLSEVGAVASNYIQAGNGNLSDGATAVQYWLNGDSAVDQLDGYGSNGGGGKFSNNVVKNAGTAGGGSAGNGSYLGTAGKGGDGTFGYQGYGGGTGVSKGNVIPVYSIFQGYAAGGGGQYDDNTNAGGAGGYGSGSSWNASGKPDYGAGANGGNRNISDGIVCLYYHNDPL